MTKRAGPLAGIRVVEFASIGPGPHCAMLLADLGADVLRIDREGGNGWPNPVVDRGRTTKVVDIRTSEGRADCLRILEAADVLIEGFRPGVMEKLGLGPEIVCRANSRIVYGRMTGWGQKGPLAKAAGHDINYIALTGALAAIGQPGEPAAIPLNLIGDFGGGSMLLAFGLVSALFERERSGKGQVVDAAIVDGVSSLMTMFAGLLPSGRISLDRSENLLGGAAPFYRTYLCADDREISVGALEPKFYQELIDRIGAPEEFSEAQNDPRNWKERSAVFERIFRNRTSQEWCKLLEGTDVCFAPVLSLEEVSGHPQMKSRQVYSVAQGVGAVKPVPEFSRTPGRICESTTDWETLVSRWRSEDTGDET